MTPIYTTKKLEKIIAKTVIDKEDYNDTLLGKWNASVLYIAKKKCLLFVNAKSLYSVMIPKFSTTDLDKIHLLFLENLYAQLMFEEIEVDVDYLVKNIGPINFHSTDNDRKINGILTHYISKIDYLKYEYPVFNNLVIREIIEKLNSEPFKQIDWKIPKEAMTALLKT